ncbi:Vacuolar protein sorting-associated protein 13A N-terminal domain-containing protein [Strongyloides ratti]|uniref:Vacuolar protein sorting-associated protein 13A N-terminal domain-containing protein n=1 Tax=Strongyloides ratti TaxID=34506 RepID=A0A090N0Q3_STRRB|nr:Vacuolar protein sorting-associated protein 13A N-terminal domain-containing protein [Strongyloides ratti]CEF71088.1 Vacuolar protein sorting-associated protein 13A N-terminal domain-containing protein [Strongyloides ratti]
MASLIKNQIIKHLSKFARNLKPEQITLDILKGKSQLRNIELNEDVLSDLLELPPWLRITKAFCNCVGVQIPWTSLKTLPIHIICDEIVIEIGLSSKCNVPTGFQIPQSTSYGFIEKIIEGMMVSVNNVEVNFYLDAFHVGLTLQRLCLESRTPQWKQTNDLKQTRFTDHSTNQTILHKHLSWQLLRIEASYIKEESNSKRMNAPLRLLTMGGSCRIGIKKNYTDGSLLAGKIQIILSAILWVGTLSQIRSVISFSQQIFSLIRTYNEANIIPVKLVNNTTLSSNTNKIQPIVSIPMAEKFSNFDINQTSFHLYIEKFDIHLCDDNSSSSEFPESWDIQNGAIQVTLLRISTDLYLKHMVNKGRKKWIKYNENNPCTEWCDDMIARAFQRFSKVLSEDDFYSLTKVWQSLTSMNFVIRIHDMVVECVSDVNTKKDAIKHMIVSNAAARNLLPVDMGIIHFEYCTYEYGEDKTLPPPSPSAYVAIGPIEAKIDPRTIRWLVYIGDQLKEVVPIDELNNLSSETSPGDEVVVRIEMISTKIILEQSCSHNMDERYPKEFFINIDKANITNCKLEIESFIEGNFNDIDYKNIYNPNCEKTTKLIKLMELIKEFNTFELFQLQNWYFSLNSMWIESSYGENCPPTNIINNLPVGGLIVTDDNILTLLINPVEIPVISLNHFQFVFFQLFITKITDLIDTIEEDQEFFFENGTSQVPPISISLFFNIKNALLRLILPNTPIPTPYDYNGKLSDDIDESPSSVEGNKLLMNDNESPTYDTILVSQNDSFLHSLNTPSKMALQSQSYVELSVLNINENIQDGVSILGETVSITTDLSDDESYIVQLQESEEEIFKDSNICVAEEAISKEVNIKNLDIYDKYMNAKSNILCANIENLQTLILLNNGNVLVKGFIKNIILHEIFDIVNEEIYKIINIDKIKSDIIGKQIYNDDTSKITFELVGIKKNIPKLSINVLDVSLDLTDPILSHLPMFFEANIIPKNPPSIEINVKKSVIVINDPTKNSTIKLKVNDIVIEK